MTTIDTTHLDNTADLLAEHELHPNHTVRLLHKDGTYYCRHKTPSANSTTEHASKHDAEKKLRETVAASLDINDATVIKRMNLDSDQLLAVIEHDGHIFCFTDAPSGAEATEHATETDAIRHLRGEIADLAKASSDEHEGTHWVSTDSDQWVVTCETEDGHVAAWHIDGESDYETFDDQDDAEEHAESVLLERFSSEAGNENPEGQTEQAARIDAALAETTAGDSVQRRGYRHLHDALLDIALSPDGPPMNVSKLATRMGVNRRTLYRWYPFLRRVDNDPTSTTNEQE